MFGTGINVMGEVIDLGTTHGLIEKSGAFFMLDGERIGQGRDNACAFLAENPEIVESLRARLLTAVKQAEPPAPAPLATDEVEEAAA